MNQYEEAVTWLDATDDYAWPIIKKRLAALEAELDSLKKEYDEEVISHDIEEKAWKAQLASLREENEQL